MNVSQGLSNPKPPELNMVSERKFVPLPLPLPLPLQLPPLTLESLHCLDETSIDVSMLKDQSSILLTTESVGDTTQPQLPTDPLVLPAEGPDSPKTLSQTIVEHLESIFPSKDDIHPETPPKQMVGLTQKSTLPVLPVNFHGLTSEDVAYIALMCEALPLLVLVPDSTITGAVCIEHIHFPGDNDERVKCDMWLRRLINAKACARHQIPCAVNAQMPHTDVGRNSRPQSGHVPLAKSSNFAGTLTLYHPKFILLKRASN